MDRDRFIARTNIRRFCDRLRTEADLKTRLLLQNLLLEEEDKLGHDLELIAGLERTIASFDALIQTQTDLVIAFEQGGSASLTEAKNFLDGLIQSQALYKEYRRRMVNSVSIKPL